MYNIRHKASKQHKSEKLNNMKLRMKNASEKNIVLVENVSALADFNNSKSMSN